MPRKTVSAIMMAWLILGTIGLSLKIQSVKAGDGTIYINADGSIDPPGSPILTVDNITYTLFRDVTSLLIIERDNIIVDGAGYTLSTTEPSGELPLILLSGRSGVTVKNMTCYAAETMTSIYLNYSSNCILNGNTVSVSYGGISIVLFSSSDNVISGNTLGPPCIWVTNNSSNNNVTGNNMRPFNRGGINIDSSSGWNRISKNNIENGDGIVINVGGSDNDIFENNITNQIDFAVGISGSYNIIFNNEIEGGISVGPSALNNTIFKNNIKAPIRLWGSNNTLYENDVSALLRLTECSNNNLYHNNFRGGLLVDGPEQGYNPVGANLWDNGYPSGGNYWSDYRGADLYSGPYQNQTGSDGIGDTPYLLAPNNRDNYPLMSPYYEFDTAVNEVSPSKTVVGCGQTLAVNATVNELGDSTVTFNLTLNAAYVYTPKQVPILLQANAVSGWNNTIPGPTITATQGDTVLLTIITTDTLHHLFYVDYNNNSFPDPGEPQTPSFINTTATIDFPVASAGCFTYYDAYNQNTMFGTITVNPAPQGTLQIGSQNVTLTTKQQENATFSWNTTGLPYGTYALNAYAEPVQGETNTANNNCTEGMTTLTIPGDINGDFKVSLQDLVLLANAYGSRPNDARWKANADIDGNNVVGLTDLVILANHYGQHYP